MPSDWALLAKAWWFDPHPRKEVKGMNDEQEKRVVEALVDFVLRVAKGNATNESEVAVLPLVARELFEVLRLH